MEAGKIKLPSNPTILITDSGLGGISVLADLEKRITTLNVFESAKLVFFNSHAKEGYGYNSMQSVEDKIKVFDSALQSMAKKFNPDVILVACNTLSVIADRTATSRESGIPVMGIVEFGTELIYNNLVKDENSAVIIYGTPTTIESDAYKQNLISLGIDSSRIVNQPCYLLETEIQKGSKSDATLEMINKFTREAASKFESNGNKFDKYFGAFCCTHYGYSKEMFLEAMSKQFRNSNILNPNNLMSEYVVSAGSNLPGVKTKIDVEVYSRVKIYDEEVESIGKIIKEDAPLTYKALNNYNYDDNLFEFDYAGVTKI